MAEMNELLTATFSLKAGEATLGRYCVAVLDSATEGVVKNPSGENDGKIAGVLRDVTLEAGETGLFQVAGIAKVKAAAAVAIGDLLVVADAQGRVKAKGTSSNPSGAGIVGRALSGAGEEDTVVKCILCIPSEFSS